MSVNLLYDGLDTAELFTRRWEHITGHTFHRWADIATVIGLLDSDRRNTPDQRKPYAMHDVIHELIDSGEFLEIQPDWASWP